MDTLLVATLRTENLGKGSARKLRTEKQIPGVLYGRGAKTLSLHVDPDALENIFRVTQNRNTVIELQIEKKKFPCLVREAQRHPVSRKLLHVDFYKVEAGQLIDVWVPVRPEGKAKGMEVGGRVRLITRQLQVRCTYEHIPEVIAVDVTPMDVNDYVRVSQIVPPEGCSFLYEKDFNVVTIEGKRADIEFEAAKPAIEGEAGGETPAAGDGAEGEEEGE